MKNLTIAVTVIAIILVIVGLTYWYRPDSTPNVPADTSGTDDIRGCYVATLGKDVYSLKIASQDGEKVAGTLVFKNFEKDSSYGTFVGTYRDGILLGDYSFNSEGMDSVIETMFKRIGTDFRRGFGEMDSSGTNFRDLNTVTYDPNQTFKSVSDCITTL